MWFIRTLRVRLNSTGGAASYRGGNYPLSFSLSVPLPGVPCSNPVLDCRKLKVASIPDAWLSLSLFHWSVLAALTSSVRALGNHQRLAASDNLLQRDRHYRQKQLFRWIFIHTKQKQMQWDSEHCWCLMMSVNQGRCVHVNHVSQANTLKNDFLSNVSGSVGSSRANQIINAKLAR